MSLVSLWLRPAFETFSTAQRVVQPRPLFRDLITRAEGHELFVSSLHGSRPSLAAFTVHQVFQHSIVDEAELVGLKIGEILPFEAEVDDPLIANYVVMRATTQHLVHNWVTMLRSLLIRLQTWLKLSLPTAK